MAYTRVLTVPSKIHSHVCVKWIPLPNLETIVLQVFTCGLPGNNWPLNHVVELTKNSALVNPILLVFSWLYTQDSHSQQLQHTLIPVMEGTCVL